MYIIALVFTIAGWTIQCYRTGIKKDRSISLALPFLYTIGCVLFGINSFILNDMAYAILDIVCAILASIVFIMLLTRKKVS